MEDALSGTVYNIYSFALMFSCPGYKRISAHSCFTVGEHSVRGAWLYRVLQNGCQQTPIDSRLNSEL